MKSLKTHEILAVLELSKQKVGIVSKSENITRFFETLGLLPNDEGIIQVDRELRISLAMRAVSNGALVESVVKHMNWKDFEGLVAQILSENNYDCVESFRRRGNTEVKGMEIDVIGLKGKMLLVIDAKMWGIRSGKASALRTAVEKQKERTGRLCKQLDRLSKKIVKMTGGNYTLLPIMVTWLVEEIELHEGVPVVPVFMLNSFLLSISEYEDMMVSYEGQLQPQFDQSTV
ncbi:MAG: hypothetical protein ACTSUO_05200 [Candidatus Thorarchaeota archaeon]